MIEWLRLDLSKSEDNDCLYDLMLKAHCKHPRLNFKIIVEKKSRKPYTRRNDVQRQDEGIENEMVL